MDNPVAGKIDGTPGKPAGQRSPGRIFAIALVMVFLGELGIMRVIAFFPGLSPVAAAFLDGVLLFCLVLPLWFFLFYRPMREKTEECNRERLECHFVEFRLRFYFYVTIFLKKRGERGKVFKY